MRFSSATFTVLFGLVAATVAAPMSSDAALDFHARDFDAEVFERDVYDSVYKRSEDGLEVCAGTGPINLKIKFLPVFGVTDPASAVPAKKEDAMKIVEFVMKSVWPKFELMKNDAPAELGTITSSNDPLNSLAHVQWSFTAHNKIQSICGTVCKGYASAIPGAGGINAIREAYVKTSAGVVLWEKKAAA